MIASALAAWLVLQASAHPSTRAVNAVVGDASFVDTFGYAPGDDVDLDLRVRTHLRWISARLRARSDRRLDEVTRRRRAALLDALDAYIDAGRFPRNRHYPVPRPRFTDEEGNVCAVGHLIAITLGRDATGQIARAHEYDFLLDMHEPLLERWAAWAGFSLRELAAIQPRYGPSLPLEGRRAFEEGRYDDALRLFEHAYLLEPRPELLYNMALSADRAGHVERAIEVYRRFVDAPDAATERRVSARIRITELETQLAHVSPHPAAVNRGCACRIARTRSGAPAGLALSLALGIAALIRRVQRGSRQRTMP